MIRSGTGLAVGSADVAGRRSEGAPDTSPATRNAFEHQERGHVARNGSILGLALGALIVAAAAGASPALAGPPPPSCQQNGCLLRSDNLVFAQGDPTYRINARIRSCAICTAPGPNGEFDMTGEAIVAFGPYDQALCNPAEEVVTVTYMAKFIPGLSDGGPDGHEQTYVPSNPGQVFPTSLPAPLRTTCMSADNLPYYAPKVFLTGAQGARGGLVNVQPAEAAYLILPESVRASEGFLKRQIDLDRLRLSQDMSFLHVQTLGPLSPLRFWPEGLPFRLGPGTIRYFPDQVLFDTPGLPVGPTAYTVVRPDPAALTAVQTLECDPNLPDQTTPCTSPAIWNAGFFDDPTWKAPASQPVRIDRFGMTLSLSLEAGRTIVYEPLFPRGTWVKVNGPASIAIQNGRIVSGSFLDGTGWLAVDRNPCPDGRGFEVRRYALHGGANHPVMGQDGSLMAGVVDLNENEANPLVPLPLAWSYNQAKGLGCGTFYVPPALTDQSPQRTWLASAVPTILDRGIYAGFNYNRDRVCQTAGGTKLGKTCATGADCDQAQGETCVDGGFSPLCPAQNPAVVPIWMTTIQEHAIAFGINPQNAAQGDREMALVARGSGITGVFDGGDDAFDFGSAGDFSFHFTRFGLAFKEDHSEHADTIVTGGLVVPWPSDTDIPLQDMQICGCGALDEARTPKVLLKKNLAYWDATFFPYGLDFSDKPLASLTCPPDNSAGSDVCPGTKANSVCVEAITPVPRFEPDPVSGFGLDPQGNPGPITPFVVAPLELDHDKYTADGTPAAQPYKYHVENFVLNDWGQAGSPDPPEVGTTEPYGYYDAHGDLSLPFFGLTPAGITIRRRSQQDTSHLVDLHEEGDPSLPGNSDFIEASRKLAADKIALPFRVDYVPASATADPNDGWNKNPADPNQMDLDDDFRARGTLFAFAPNSDPDPAAVLDLGSVKVASGLLLRPPTPGRPELEGGDLGPIAVLRLYGALKPGSKNRLDAILDPALYAPWSGQLDGALQALGGQVPAPYDLGGAEVLRSILADDPGILAPLAGHPDAHGTFNVNPQNLSPPMNATRLTGFLDFSDDLQNLEAVQAASNLDTEGQFFKMDSSLLTIDRHVKNSGQAITQFTREQLPDASKNMELPGKQDIPFPEFPGMKWDFDYAINSVPPYFEFKSLTGSIDLTKGGLSGVGFDKLGATLKFWNDGDWYFSAEAKLNFDGYGGNGAVLLGNCKDMTPLREVDPNVADFLSGVSKFDGGFLKLGVHARIFDFGCPFWVSAGIEVGGWYVTGNLGGKVRGWMSGKGACLVSIRGDFTLMGGEVNDLFKLTGAFWVAGGVGFCDEEDWDTPADVLDDDFCAACVFEAKVTGTYPPKDLNLTLDGPDVECAAP
jgi:hypothetical protein